MSEIRRQITVEAPPLTAEAEWTRFVNSELRGPRRLACDEIACVDAVRLGMVSFEAADEGRTTVVFRLDLDGQSPVSTDVLAENLGHDLVVFKDHIDSGAGNVPASVNERRERQDREARKRHEPRPDHLARGYEAASNKDMWPT